MGFGKRRQKPAGSAGQTMEMKQKGMKQKGATPVANPIDKFNLLPPEEAEILKAQTRPATPKVKFKTLYRYASWKTMALFFLANLGAIIGGAAVPFMAVIFGRISGSFKSFFTGELSASGLRSDVQGNVIYFVYLAVGEFIAVYISVLGHITVGRTVSDQIREKYLEACLRQNIGFHDTLGAGTITTRITADMNTIQDGISDKIGLTVGALSTFVAALVISYYEYWKLALILSSSIIAMLLIMVTSAKFRVTWVKKSMIAYAIGSNVAEEAISGIRTSSAYSMQEMLARKYDVFLTQSAKWGVKGKTMIGVMMGGFFFIMNMIYGLAFWQGNAFMTNHEVSMQGVMITVMSVLNAAMAVGNCSTNMQSIVTALSVAGRVFELIDRKSLMDPISEEGLDLGHLDYPAEIRFEHIKHIYPTRPDATILHDFSLVCPAGQKTALVGGSGSGKSTCIGLLERFYSPVKGRVLFDGHDITEVSLRSLRQQISLVGQEPTLFSTTIYENIRYGLIGSRFENAEPGVQRQLIVRAAKMANAHNFIMQQEDEYQTNVGDRGSLLSGGQRQRIAIARAVVSDPKVLLLDEATSALDAESERIVQEALEVASRGRTTIIIAHRLSTIRSAQNIVVMGKGEILEKGSHHSLMAQRGAYYQLVENQRMNPVAPKVDPKTARKSKRLSYFNIKDQLTNFEKDVDDAFAMKKESYRESCYSDTGSIAGLVNKNKSKFDDDDDDAMPDLYEEPPPKKYSTWQLIKMIAGLNKSDWPWMLFGLFWSIVAGVGQPTQSGLFGLQVDNMSLWPVAQTADHTTKRANFLSIMYIVLAAIQIIAFTLQSAAFSLCSERLVHKARLSAFKAIMRQDIAYFDLDENNPGALVSFLGTEANTLAGLSGPTLGSICMLIATLVACLGLAFVVGWKLALVAAATIPILLACGFLRVWALARYEKRAKAGYKASAGYACEATSAVRTIASLGREREVVAAYKETLDGLAKKDRWSIWRTSALYAASQSLIFGIMALGFWWGGTLMSEGQLTMAQFFICFPTIVFGAQSAGNVFSYAPDMGKAQEAARELKVLLDRQPPIDSWSSAGHQISRDDVKGSIRFQNVQFVYPTRPDKLILNGLNLAITPGQYVAFVGSSGCGKSTAIGLLERFYHANGGCITLDGTNITDLNLSAYRSCIALVSQEPTIYSGTIRDNIIFGLDPSTVSEAAIEAAARDANLFDFVTSLPDGFATKINGKGSTLSGGQKQRIAIARALLRDPKILLLDEATSALDSESEKLVQEALDRAAKGRTTIAIAHRLSTVQKADTIYYFEKGQIAESGSHEFLMAKGTKYRELVRQQEMGA